MGCAAAPPRAVLRTRIAASCLGSGYRGPGFYRRLFMLWKCANIRSASATSPLNNSNAFTA